MSVEVPCGSASLPPPTEDVGPNLVTPANYIEFYGDPFSLVTGTQIGTRDKGKGKEIVRTQSVQRVGSSVDDRDRDRDRNKDEWTKYEPPEALWTTKDAIDTILLEVITRSIENIKTRIAEENERKRQQQEEEDEAAREREAQDAAEDGDAAQEEREPYLPIIIPPEKPQPSEEAQSPIMKQINAEISAWNLENGLGNGEGSSTQQPPANSASAVEPKKKKKRRFNLARFLRKMGDREDHRHAGGPLWAGDIYSDLYSSPTNRPKERTSHESNDRSSFITSFLTAASQLEPETGPEPPADAELV